MVAALTSEPATAHVHAWLGAADPAGLLVSDWVTTEVSSALALKVRTGALDPAQRAHALGAYHRMLAESFTVLPVAPGHFHAAARFVDRYDLSLRAGDALHLALAADRDATLVTLDRRLITAGPILGAAVEGI